MLQHRPKCERVKALRFRPVYLLSKDETNSENKEHLLETLTKQLNGTILANKNTVIVKDCIIGKAICSTPIMAQKDHSASCIGFVEHHISTEPTCNTIDEITYKVMIPIDKNPSDDKDETEYVSSDDEDTLSICSFSSECEYCDYCEGEECEYELWDSDNDLQQRIDDFKNEPNADYGSKKYYNYDRNILINFSKSKGEDAIKLHCPDLFSTSPKKINFALCHGQSPDFLVALTPALRKLWKEAGGNSKEYFLLDIGTMYKIQAILHDEAGEFGVNDTLGHNPLDNATRVIDHYMSILLTAQSSKTIDKSRLAIVCDETIGTLSYSEFMEC